MAGYFENYLRTYKDYVQAVASTQAGGSGTAIGSLKEVPQGQLWRLIRYSVFSNSSGTPVFELFTAAAFELNSANFALDRSRRQDYTANGKNNVADNNSPPVFDEGETPLFVWTGGSNGDICQAYVTIAVYEKVPNITMREVHSLHQQESNEDLQRQDAIVVGGSGWNAGLYVPDDMYSNAYQPWASRDPADAADNPAQFSLPPGVGKYVGGVAEGAEHPDPPYEGRILPDGSTDSAS